MQRALTKEQKLFLVNTLYPEGQQDIANAVIAVMCQGDTVYNAEKQNDLPHNSLRSKINRVQKQIKLIEQVLNH